MVNMYYEQPYQYIHGDPWKICDRCGRKLRQSETKKTWDNLIVCPNDWEPRHPQELIHDTPADKQTVMDARPRPAITDESTTIATAGSAGDSTIDVVSISGMSDTQQITITLDNLGSLITTINGTPSGTTVTLTDKLTGSAAVGNYVVVSTTGTTQSDL